MKTSAIFILALLIETGAKSQVKISETPGNPNPSAMLDVESSGRGFLPPRMTTAQRDAMENPADGLIIFNISTGCPNYRFNGEWYIWCGIPEVGSVASLNCSGLIQTGTLVSGEPAENVWIEISYSGGNGGLFTSQLVPSTGVSGISASISSGVFVNGNGSVVFSIQGTPDQSGTAQFALSIGGENCLAELDVSEPPFVCGSSISFLYSDQNVTYGSVLGADGKCWLDRNLGAAQVATNSTDFLAYGDLFQWGRAADGHQIISWTSSNSGLVGGTTSVLSNSDTPGHGELITTNYTGNIDWRDPQNHELWQGLSGQNNPCPSGWRVPSESEWDVERMSWSENNSDGAFASPLKLTLAGYRYFEGSGPLYSTGSDGYYWSSTVIETSARRLDVGISFANMNSGVRAFAFPVRCVKGDL